MNYIVLDLEWNQCPSGKFHEVKSLPFEIIEIGAVKLNENHEMISSFREIVKPQVYRSLHFRTQEVINLRSIDFVGTRTFQEIIPDFITWCGENPSFCTWGPADLTELQRNLSYYNLYFPFPFPLIYFDIQKIFSIVYEDRKTRRSLETAADFLKIAKDIPFHSALSDALYTARIMEYLSEEQIQSNSSIDCFHTPENRKQEIRVQYNTYAKFISRPFDSKVSVMKDRIVVSTACYLCKKNIQKKIRWFSVGSSNYYCLAYCSKHGFMKGKIRIRQRPDQKYYAIKTTKLITDDQALEIKEKKEVQRIKRKLRREFQRKPI